MCKAALAGKVIGGIIGAHTHHALTLHCMLQLLAALLVGAAACMPSCRCPGPQRVPYVKHQLETWEQWWSLPLPPTMRLASWQLSPFIAAAVHMLTGILWELQSLSSACS